MHQATEDLLNSQQTKPHGRSLSTTLNPPAVRKKHCIEEMISIPSWYFLKI